MSEPIEFRPSPKYQLHLWATITCVFVFLILPFILLGLIPEFGVTYVLIFLAANLLWLAPAFLLTPVYYRSVQYRLTDSELVVRRGIVVRAEDVVPYTMITNIAVRRGPIQRLLGLATLHVHTAGYSQQAGTEAKIEGMEDGDKVRAQLLDLIHKHQMHTAARPAPAVEAARLSDKPDQVPVLVGEILDELRQLRSELTQR